jgi:hypothetical protein
MRLIDELAERVGHFLNGLEQQAGAGDDWLMIVRESHLLFVSWPLPAEQVRPLVAPSLELDLYNGQAWITIEMLETAMIRLRHLPAPPLPLTGYEMNVRTYVRCNGERGIHFLSMDCPGYLGTTFAKWRFHLPMHEADVTVSLNGDNYHAESVRSEDNASPPRFAYSGRLMGPPARLAAGTLDAFLLNQTVLFTTDAEGRVFRAVVDHRPHVVQPIAGVIEINTLIAAVGLTVAEDAPSVLYSPGDDSLAWPMARVEPPPTPQ